MSSKTHILPAAALATFVIMAAGFGVDSMLARSSVQPSGYQSREIAQQPTPVRVILPASAEPAHPPEPSTVVVSASELPPAAEPAKAVRAPGEWKENVDTRGAAAAEERRRRYSERKSRSVAAARQQMLQLRPRPEAAILAFGGDDPSRGGSFGN
jgi:hypothetical protein